MVRGAYPTSDVQLAFDQALQAPNRTYRKEAQQSAFGRLAPLAGFDQLRAVLRLESVADFI